MSEHGQSYIVFEVGGDIARNIMGTAVTASLKKAYPERDIVVVTFFPEIWMHNPDIFRVHKLGTLTYFYDEYIKGKDTLIFRHDPASTSDFLYDRKHFIDIWCDLCGVPRAKSMPSLHFTWREKEAVGKLTASPKPLFLIHATSSMAQVANAYNWQKDIPIPVAEAVVRHMNERGYASVQLREANQPALAGTLSVELPLRQKLCALSYSTKRLFIDSHYLQAATALDLPSVAAYVTGSPAVTGAPIHTPIAAFSHLWDKEKKQHADFIRFVESYKEGYDITGTKSGCPFPLDPLFSAEALIKALETES